MKKILVIDNYDSFVHNAVQLLRESSEPVNITIQLNDRIDFEKFGDYDGILLSPGPGIPEEAGDLMAAIGQIVRQRIPVLGICLDIRRSPGRSEPNCDNCRPRCTDIRRR